MKILWLEIGGKKRKPTSQKEKVLAYLQTGKSLSQIDALKMGMGLRLSARIHQLRKSGYLITCDTKKGYGIYTLVS